MTSRLDLLRLGIATLLWCSLHSALIAPRIGRILSARLGRWQRLLYNLLAIATLIPLLLYRRSLAAAPLFDWSGPWRPLPLLSLAAAALLFAGGARGYSLGHFAGLRQIRGGAEAVPGGALRTGGLLSATRHPWYLASLLLIWALPQDRAGLLFHALLSAYLIVGTLLEERKLVGEFGDAYRDYRRRVPMLLPWKWPLERLRGRR